MSTKKTITAPNPDDLLDEVSHHVAQAAVMRRKSTAQERTWSKAVGAQLEARVAELRRNLTPADPTPETSKPIRPSTLAMARDALLSGVAQFLSALMGEAEPGFAYRNHKRLSDDDLRRLYDLLDPIAREQGGPPCGS